MGRVNKKIISCGKEVVCLDIWNGEQFINFSDVIDHLRKFEVKIIDLEYDKNQMGKEIEELEAKVIDKTYEIERLQKLLDENGIDY